MPDKTLPKKFTFSQASLQDYHDCEKRFQLKYIENLAWPSIEVEPVLENERRQLEGQRFHRLVQQHLSGIPVEILSKHASTFPLSLWWKNYLDADLQLGSSTLFPEATLVSSIGKHKVTAKYDLIAIDGTSIRIFDWKTYHTRPNESIMRLRYQTRVYCWLLTSAASALVNGKKFNPEDLEMIYWFTNFPNQPIRISYSASQFKNDSEHLANLTKRIEEQQDFRITEDESKCRFCVYRSYCDRGITAGNWDEDIEISLDMPDLLLEDIEEIEF